MSDSGKLNDFWSYDPELNVWGKRALNGDLAPEVRSHHSAILHHDNLILYGGNSDEAEGSVWQLNMLTKAWHLLRPGDRMTASDSNNTPPSTDQLTSEMFWFTHRISPNRLLSFQTVSILFVVIELRRKATSELPRARAMHKAAIFENRLYIFGGVFIDSSARPDELTNELWCFDLSSKRWTNMRTSTLDRQSWPAPRAG